MKNILFLACIFVFATGCSTAKTKLTEEEREARTEQLLNHPKFNR